MQRRKGKVWKWVPSTVDSFPVNSVLAGHYQGNKIYVARAHHSGSLMPGRFSVPERMTVLAWKGQEVAKSRYEILVAEPKIVKWIEYDPAASLLPFNAIEGGYSELFHEKLFIGRVQNGEDTLIGSVNGRRRTCTVSVDGQVLEIRTNFEILIEGE